MTGELRYAVSGWWGCFWCGQSSVLCEVVWRDIAQGLERKEWVVMVALCKLTEGHVKWRDRLGPGNRWMVLYHGHFALVDSTITVEPL